MTARVPAEAGIEVAEPIEVHPRPAESPTVVAGEAAPGSAAWTWLPALGIVSAALYCVVATRPYLLFDHIGQPGLHIATAANYSVDEAARFAGGFLLLFALYIAGYRLLARSPLIGRGGLALVLLPALVFHLL